MFSAIISICDLLRPNRSPSSFPSRRPTSSARNWGVRQKRQRVPPKLKRSLVGDGNKVTHTLAKSETFPRQISGTDRRFPCARFAEQLGKERNRTTTKKKSRHFMVVIERGIPIERNGFRGLLLHKQRRDRERQLGRILKIYAANERWKKTVQQE